MSGRTTTAEPKGASMNIGEAREDALALVPVEERGIRGLSLATQMFTPEEREQVAALLSVPKNSPALLPYLALCIAEGFSPWANHVWLIPKKVKVPSADGSGEVEETKHLPAVGRDGLLHKARMTKGKVGGYRGMTFNVVCERDTFEVEYTGDEMTDPKVMHRFASKPTTFEEGEAPDRYRGRVIGAWAKLRIDGEPPVFYYANLREHGRLRHVWAWDDAARRRKPLYHALNGGVTFSEMAQNAQGQTVQLRPVQEWEGAWDYLSTMILKSAQSYVCRIGLGVTGFVPVDELRDVEEWQNTPTAQQAATGSVAIEAFDFAKLDVPDELRERLQKAIDTANELDPFSWGPAKCEMVLHGRTADELASIVEEVERQNDLREQTIAKQAGQPAEEPIADAEVVEDAPAPTTATVDEATAERIEFLRGRARELRAHIEAAEEAGDETGASRADLDQIEAEIAMLGGQAPGQEGLGI